MQSIGAAVQIRILNTQKTHQKMNMPGWGTVPNPEDWAVLDRLEQQEQIEHENEGMLCMCRHCWHVCVH